MRRLVVCFDGTWNTPDQSGNPTNVVKMVRAVCPQDGPISQIVFYDKGVGTGGFLDRILGGASGVGLTENMLDGYRFLGNNYADGDEIYVFGFSRGAYTARTLVGFLALAGLFTPAYLGRPLKKAVDIYRDPDLEAEQKANKIKELAGDPARRTQVRCLGVWDTVGSLGIPGDLGRRLLKKIFHFSSVGLSGIVDVALHAVAIDEKRSAFAPTLWVGNPRKDRPANQIVEQVWFPGVHSNIGGSYLDAGLSDTTLDWMIKRVRHHTGLRLDEQRITPAIARDHFGKIVESRSGMYKSSVAYPYQRLIGQVKPKSDGVLDWIRDTFPRYDRRNIPPDGLVPVNELIHISAIERLTRPCVNDCREDKQCKTSSYAPPTLMAALSAIRSGKDLKIVNWDGTPAPAKEFVDAARLPETRPATAEHRHA